MRLLKQKTKATLHPQESQKILQNYTHNNNFLEKQKKTEVPSCASVMQHNPYMQFSQQTVVFYTKLHRVFPPLIQKQYLQPCMNKQVF